MLKLQWKLSIHRKRSRSRIQSMTKATLHEVTNQHVTLIQLKLEVLTIIQSKRVIYLEKNLSKNSKSKKIEPSSHQICNVNWIKAARLILRSIKRSLLSHSAPQRLSHSIEAYVKKVRSEWVEPASVRDSQ